MTGLVLYAVALGGLVKSRSNNIGPPCVQNIQAGAARADGSDFHEELRPSRRISFAEVYDKEG